MQPSPASERPFVIAITCSDLHLWDTPPAFRQNEPDWWEAMQRPLEQIKTLQGKYKAPILFAGDLFDRWKASPELINWAIKNLPVMYSIPGQHDLPNHRYEDIRKSAYWTLVEAGRLIDIKPGMPYPVSDDLLVHGFPWGHKVMPIGSHLIRGYNVALIHAYCWMTDFGYHGAPEDRKVGEWRNKLGGYTFSVFGDNHRGFVAKKRDAWVINNGSMIRRKSDEANYKPRVSLLWSDGDVSVKEFDTSEDVDVGIKQAVKSERAELDPAAIISALKGMKQSRIDFVEAVKEIMETVKTSDETRAKIMEACGE